MYLVFYISVTLIIISLITEVKVTRSGGYVHTQAPAPVTTHTTVVVNQQIPLQPQYQQQIPLQPQYPQQGKHLLWWWSKSLVTSLVTNNNVQVITLHHSSLLRPTPSRRLTIQDIKLRMNLRKYS